MELAATACAGGLGAGAVGSPLGGADPLPGRRAEVVGDHSEYLSMPGAVGLRFGHLLRDGGYHEPESRQLHDAPEAPDEPHILIIRAVTRSAPAPFHARGRG